MNYRRVSLFAIALLPSAHAQVRPPANPIAPPPAAAPAPTRGVVYLLNKHMTGQHVISAGYGWLGDATVLDEKAFARAKDLPGMLKVICTAVSFGDEALVPFTVGNAYVLAPKTMEEINRNANSTVLDVMGEGAQIDCVLASLTPAQVTQIGTSGGLAVRNLTAEAQRILTTVFRPPLKMPDGSVLEEALDWRNVRLRASLRQTAWVPTGGGGKSPLHGSESGFDGLRPVHLSPDILGTNSAVLRQAPNAYRPSGLTGAGYQQAIGIEGVMTVDAALKQAAKVTGLRLRSAKLLRDVPVFLGSRHLTAGEVIDGLRLGVTGAFRKLDNEYILAWDRIGLGALQQYTEESANAGTERDARQRIDQATSSPIRELLATRLPFDSADPLALTPEQQASLFDTSRKPSVSQPAETLQWDNLRLIIPFAEMTPEQRQYLSDLAKTATIFMHTSEANGELQKVAVTETDLQNSYLENTAYVSLSLSLPERGWTRLASFGYGELSGPDLARQEARRKMEGEMEARRTGSMAEGQTQIDAWQPTPVVLSAPKRALMIPALALAHVVQLGKDMKRHGFNVLFYPALNDGYATFPNNAFPLEPRLRGRNGLANAVAAMTPLGIQVVPYVSVLAWKRSPGVHWLDKHPDWLERDILNRTRLEYLADHSSWKDDPVAGILGSAEFVRASEPLVARKLSGLMADLAAQHGLTGVAFVDWTTSTGPRESISTQPPRVGFSVRDRIATLRKEGEDPVDRPMDPHRPSAPFWPQAFRELGIDANGAGAQSTPEQFGEASVALVNGLLNAAKTAHPDWTTYVVKEPDWPLHSTVQGATLTRAPAGDSTVIVSRSMDPGMKIALMLPVWPRSLTPSGFPEAMRKYPPITILTATDPGASPTPIQAPLIILDFRASPDEMPDSLQWIAAPVGPG